MKQIAIGDTHGRKSWKEIVKQNPDADRIIFIGDYFDSFDITSQQQFDNFLEICEFKNTSEKEVIMLIGNHDYHYMNGINEHYSGYQPAMRQVFEIALEQNKNLLQVCFIDENEYVYSHAGLTESWLYLNGIGSTSIFSIVDIVNDLFKHKPNNFAFYPGDRSGYGDHIMQPPLWVRPNSLYRDGIKNLQIVGHTKVNRIEPLKSARQGFYIIDTLENNNPELKQYLIIDNGKIEIKSLKKLKHGNKIYHKANK